jgi:hypothetical protein
MNMLKRERGTNVEQPDFSGSVGVSLQKNGYTENLHNSILAFSKVSHRLC